MNPRVMFIERVDEDTWIRCMPVWVVDTLIRLPEWLESDSPGVRERLLPRAYDDEEDEREWRQHITPELEYLFQSRGEIVRRDLTQLQIDPPGTLDPDGAGADPDADTDADPDAEPDADSEETEAVPGEGITFTLKIPGKHLSAWLTSLQAATHAV
ncbi:MAG: hypothetical protein ACYTGO_16870, partial [Planctomycetota bacterium]